MATAWDVPTVGWTVIVMGWLLSPIFTLLAPKILSYLCFDAKQMRRDLKTKIIPELLETLGKVDQERMMQRGEVPHVSTLDEMAAWLRHALEDAEDIRDDAQENIVVADILYGRCLGIARIVRRGWARLLHKILLFRLFLRRAGAFFRKWSGDVEMLKADLNKNLCSMWSLLTENRAFLRQLMTMSPVDRLRMVPETLRADMLNTILELRRLRPEDTLEEADYVHMLVRLLLIRGQPEPAQEEAEDTAEDIHEAPAQDTARDIHEAHEEAEDTAEDIHEAQAQDTAQDSSLIDKMVEWLRQAEEEDILHQTCIDRFKRSCIRITGIVCRGSSRLLQVTASVVATCIARFNMSCMWIGGIVQSGSARWNNFLHGQQYLLPMFTRHPHQTGATASDVPTMVATTGAASDESALVTAGAVASDETGPVATTAEVSGNEIVPVIAGAVASDETGPVVTTVEVSRNEIVPVTAGAVSSDETGPVTTTAEVSRNETVPVTAGAVASDETCPVTTTAEVSRNEIFSVTTGVEASDDEPDPVTTRSDSSGRWLSCLCSLFDLFKNCCTSLYSWLAHVFKAACIYRDWSYEAAVGIEKCQENASVLDLLPTAISRRNLKKRIEKVESTINEVKGSPLLSIATKSKPIDIANKNRIQVRADSNRKVFGREKLRDDIMAELRKTPHGDAPSSSTSPCYSVIGIYGVAGSGKTTFAGYIRDYIKEEYKEKLFDTIMCIHVSETFSVDDIFHEMLKDITKHRHSNISDHGVLNEKLKEALHGKRFFLILDDLWVNEKNDQQLEELISPLNVGLKGSKILVTARTKDAARALCDDEPIEMPELGEDEYLAMFMHYAQCGLSVARKEFVRVGRKIAEKLCRSPIAAVIVAGQLGANPDIRFWENAAKLDMLNDTMGALWWSYQQLDPDIRRCFEFCILFPQKSKLRRDELVRLWIAQGFVKTNHLTKVMEDVAEGYVQKLVSCSFLQPGEDGFHFFKREYLTIHDLLHALADMVTGSDFFRIKNEGSQRGKGWKGDVPRDVRHLFVQNYDAELITEKILGLKHLRTLIFESDKPVQVDEKVIESICKRLPKLRVLVFDFCLIMESLKFSFPESISQLTHLRYLAIRDTSSSSSCPLILPSALAKCHHIQTLDIGGCNLEFAFSDLINLRHIIRPHIAGFPNIGRMISLQTIPSFAVRNEQGYEIKQLSDLDKLRGRLAISGLENVKSKGEAVEANLAAKEGLTELNLIWGSDGDDTRCNPEVEAEVLEGLCPPKGLKTLQIMGYKGSRYPDWMVSKQNGGPEELQSLCFSECNQLGPCPEFEAFPHLCLLEFEGCSWDTLPQNVEHLTSLVINRCENIRSLPALPQSLEKFSLYSCNDGFMESCQIEGHPNWHKLKHIPKKTFHPAIWGKRILRLDLTGLKQLRGINKLPDEMEVYGLETVKSKEEALEANLAAKEGLAKLMLRWRDGDDTRCGPEDEAEVLEGLCPPVGLQALQIWGYRGSRHPDWMVGKQKGGPKDLQKLELDDWKQLGAAPELGAFIHLRELWIWDCIWDALPGSMEHLTLLSELWIFNCMNIRSLPTLPQYLEQFCLDNCDDELMKSCQTEGHPNWHKIKHIPLKLIYPRIPFLEEKIQHLDFSMGKDMRVDINNLPDEMVVYGLETIKSKKKALKANLAAKEGLAKLTLRWCDDDDRRHSPEDEAEVLEGMCPPVGLETLHILSYRGSRYPDWMVGEHNGGPKYLQQLWFWRCSQL